MCVHVEARGWYHVFSLVLLHLIFWHRSLPEPRTHESSEASWPLRSRHLSLSAPGLGLQRHAAPSDILCGLWGSGLRLSACPSDHFTNWASLQALHQHLCSKVEALAPGKGLCTEACVSAGLSRVTLPSGITWHDSGFIPVKGDTISFLM